VTFTATVSSSATAKATGTVTFLASGKSIGTGTLSSGVATLKTSALAVGTNSITATYAGDADYKTSTSAALSQAIDETATTTKLVSSLNPSSFDQGVTFTATVASAYGTPTGTVSFLANGKALGSGTLSGGVATLNVTTLAVGTNSITATYAGDADYKTSTSAAVSEITDAAATTTTVASSLNPSTVGQSVTLTATVKPATAGTATGTVTFMDGTTSLGTKTLSSGTATLATTTLASGANSITAVYAASADYKTSTSSALTQTVNPATSVIPAARVPDKR
jgi:predicted secreted protein